MKTLDNISDALIAVDTLVAKTKGNVKVAYVGGVPTTLLNDPSTTIDLANKQAITKNTPIDGTRENGTPRDIDLLCLTDSREQFEAFYHRLNKEVHSRNSPRVPLISMRSYETEVKKRAYIQLVSQSSKKDSTIILSVGDIQEVLDATTFEDLWTIRYRGRELPILHPINHMYQYHIRSIAGIRQKDYEKISILNGNLRRAIPQEEFDKFSPILRLEERLKTELSIMGILKARSLHRASLLLSKKLMQTIETRPSLMAFLQNDSPLIKTAVHRIIRNSTSSFRDIDQSSNIKDSTD